MRREGAERRNQKPGEPHTLATSLHADAIHAVIPIADADERQTVGTRRCRLAQRAETVLVDRPLLIARTRQVVDLVLVRLQCAHR